MKLSSYVINILYLVPSWPRMRERVQGHTGYRLVSFVGREIDKELTSDQHVDCNESLMIISA